MNLPGDTMKLERVHRKGPKSNTDRAIVVRFLNWKDRDIVWKVRPKKDSTGNPTAFRISQDFPPEIVARRRRLIQILTAAKQAEGYKDAYVYDDKLVVNDSVYTVDTLHLLPDDQDPAKISTQQRGAYILGRQLAAIESPSESVSYREGLV